MQIKSLGITYREPTLKDLEAYQNEVLSLPEEKRNSEVTLIVALMNIIVTDWGEYDPKTFTSNVGWEVIKELRSSFRDLFTSIADN